MIRSIFEVFAFEVRRTLTPGRSVHWLALVLLPALLLWVVRQQSGHAMDVIQATWTIYFMVPIVSCMLGLLLWATPAVQSEQEGQTWIYLAVRPHGKFAVVLGKYLVAIAWTISAGLFSTTACILASQVADRERLWGTISLLVILSSLSYGALYLLIGVLFTRRGIVIAVSYTLIVELAVSLIPATVNKLTISHRLRTILADGMGLEQLRSAAGILFGEKGALQHLLILLAYTICLLIAALFVLRNKEVTMISES